jgi:hypothetical protein
MQQKISVIITTRHVTAVLDLLGSQGIFTGNEPGSQVKARYGDLLITWPVPNGFPEAINARAALEGWCERAKCAGLIADSIVMVINAGDEPGSEEERHRTLTLVSRWAAVCEDLLADLDFCDFNDGSIVLVEDDDACGCGTSHDYWRLTVRVESTRTRELISWCEQAQASRLIKTYELL